MEDTSGANRYDMPLLTKTNGVASQAGVAHIVLLTEMEVLASQSRVASIVWLKSRPFAT